MRDVNGSRYSCFIPQPEHEKQQQQQQGGDGGGGGGEQVAPEQSLVSQKTPEELLDSLSEWDG